jgi:hypothetical protein
MMGRALLACRLGAAVALLLVLLVTPAGAADQASVDAARNRGLAWLFSHQRGDGSWPGPAGAEVVTTATGVEALLRAGVRTYPFSAALTWLGNAPPASVDALARSIQARAQSGAGVAAAVELLLQWRNADRTWGAYEGFETSFPDTPLALAAIRASQIGYDPGDLATALCLILVAQKDGAPAVAGSWSYIWPGSAAPSSATGSAILPTAQNVLEIHASKVATQAPGVTCGAFLSFQSAIDGGVAWLLTRRNADGGFGEQGVSTVLDTALAYQVLSTVDVSALPQAVGAAGPALDWLIARQSPIDGSWNADAFQTAYVLKLLPPPPAALGDKDRDGIPNAVETVLGTSVDVADSRWLARGTGRNHLTALAPSTALVGAPAFILTVTGEGFAPSAVVQWNGARRTTTYVSATELRAAIAASDVDTAGAAAVTVFNPPPGAGTSTPLPFTTEYPVPVLSGIKPKAAAAGRLALTVTVSGASFTRGSVVRWNASDRATTFVSGTQLLTSIPASDLELPTTASVSVSTPGPGGGTSASRTFTVNEASDAIVIDDGQSGTSFMGSWSASTAPGPFGTGSLQSSGSGLDTYRWTPVISRAGYYGVYVWWTAAPARSTAVPYTVAHKGAQQTLTVNQQIGGGGWHLLGTFQFAKGSAGYVQVSDLNGEASADAVRLDPVSGAPKLTVTMTGTGSGTVTSIPGGIACPPDCTEIYASGTAVTLTAAPGAGATFAGWSGDADCAEGVLAVVASRACVATFTGQDIVVDNDSPQGATSFTGEWLLSEAPLPYGPSSRYSGGSGSATYRWRPTIPATRSYAVHAWWTASSTRSTAVTYLVAHAGGQTPVTVDQQEGGGTWQLLGTFVFNAGTGGYVELSDTGSGNASADAVRFVPQ